MVLAEFIGTGILVFFGCMGCVPMNGIPLEISSIINFGFTIMMIVQIFGHISFAILNPAVTIAAVVNKLITIKMAVAFIVAEIIGACLGYGLLIAVTPDDVMWSNDHNDPGICMTLPHSTISPAQAFLIEFCLTFTLICVVCGVWDPRNKKFGDSTPIKIGLTIIALSISGGPYTGASMNPARSLGPALWNWNWENHWIYWVAPISGGIVASFIYKAIFWREEPKLQTIEEYSPSPQTTMLTHTPNKV
ncbi:unnamed protein product [Diamesa serratosioi]